MAPEHDDRRPVEGGETRRRFMATCDDCTFETEVEGRDRAERIAQRHKNETDHAVLAVELPPKA